MRFLKKNALFPRVTFATTCWEGDWRTLLLDNSYLCQKQIKNHCFDFSRKMIIINNVEQENLVIEQVKQFIRNGILTDFYIASKQAKQILSFFCLSESDFIAETTDVNDGKDKSRWLYYNSLGVLTAIYFCETDYLLYVTGDVWLKKEISWIDIALKKMQKHPSYKVANLIWNSCFEEAKRESYKRDGPFFVSKCGFSDQMFLVRTRDFRAPIYQEIRKDSNHFPHGNTFEKRVFSFMKNHGWKRITYRFGSYHHRSF